MIKSSKFYYYKFILLNLYRRQVTTEQGNEVKEKNKFNLFMETSAKNGFNVNELFFQVGKILYEETLKKQKIDKVRNI